MGINAEELTHAVRQRAGGVGHLQNFWGGKGQSDAIVIGDLFAVHADGFGGMADYCTGKLGRIKTGLAVLAGIFTPCTELILRDVRTDLDGHAWTLRHLDVDCGALNLLGDRLLELVKDGV